MDLTQCTVMNEMDSLYRFKCHNEHLNTFPPKVAMNVHMHACFLNTHANAMNSADLVNEHMIWWRLDEATPLAVIFFAPNTLGVYDKTQDG